MNKIVPLFEFLKINKNNNRYILSYDNMSQDDFLIINVLMTDKIFDFVNYLKNNKTDNENYNKLKKLFPDFLSYL